MVPFQRKSLSRLVIASVVVTSFAVNSAVAVQAQTAATYPCEFSADETQNDLCVQAYFDKKLPQYTVYQGDTVLHNNASDKEQALLATGADANRAAVGQALTHYQYVLVESEAAERGQLDPESAAYKFATAKGKEDRARLLEATQNLVLSEQPTDAELQAAVATLNGFLKLRYYDGAQHLQEVQVAINALTHLTAAQKKAAEQQAARAQDSAALDDFLTEVQRLDAAQAKVPAAIAAGEAALTSQAAGLIDSQDAAAVAAAQAAREEYKKVLAALAALQVDSTATLYSAADVEKLLRDAEAARQKLNEEVAPLVLAASDPAGAIYRPDEVAEILAQLATTANESGLQVVPVGKSGPVAQKVAQYTEASRGELKNTIADAEATLKTPLYTEAALEARTDFDTALSAANEAVVGDNRQEMDKAKTGLDEATKGLAKNRAMAVIEETFGRWWLLLAAIVALPVLPVLAALGVLGQQRLQQLG